MSEFNSGDRVRYNGNHPTFRDQAMIGKLGTVETYRPTGANIVSVRWDNGASTRVYVGNVQNLTQDTARDILTAFDVPAGFLSPFTDYFTTKPAANVTTPEPTLQETLRKGAKEAHKQGNALQAYAAASNRLADSIDRLENLTK